MDLVNTRHLFFFLTCLFMKSQTPEVRPKTLASISLWSQEQAPLITSVVGLPWRLRR